MKVKIQVEIKVPAEKPTARKLTVWEKVRKHYLFG